MTIAPSNEYISTLELCRRLSICRRTVENHGLQRFAIRVGERWRYRWSDVLAFYAGKRSGLENQEERVKGGQA